MASRAAPKPGRSVGKPPVKTTGKDQAKGDKVPASVLEIVPGKFNETDWLSLLENDDTEDFIADIFESIWTDTSKQIEQIYIRQQLLPFTLMMTENALSNVIQWAFLERDQPKPVDGDFWNEDSEPIPCTMDNWGEGVVPACREERPSSMEPLPTSIGEQLPSSETNLLSLNDADLTSRPLDSPSSDYALHSLRSGSGTKIFDRVEQPQHHPAQNDQERASYSEEPSSEKVSSSREEAQPPSVERRPYNHDVLVIETQPPRLEPLSDLFYPTPMRTSDSSSSNPTPATTISKRRRMPAPKAASQLGSEDLVSTTNGTETTMTKGLRKHESKLFDDQRLEEVIARAPVASHSILKSILSRPPGYRDLELDDYGNVIAIAKLDPDKLGPRSIRVKCDVIKPRKPALDIRPPPPKPSQSIKPARSDMKLAPVKLVLPEHSTEVGDLIQPVPGVLYEDSKLKKGDPRRYQTGLAKYTNFHDDSRPLRPIARRGDLAVLQVANELLRQSKGDNGENDNEHDPQIPKLHRLSRIPPIMSGSSTSSA